MLKLITVLQAIPLTARQVQVSDVLLYSEIYTYIVRLQILYGGKLRYEVFDIKLGCGTGGGRTYTKDDMEAALDALRERSLSLTRASEKFGIPPTTLWQVNFPNI